MRIQVFYFLIFILLLGCNKNKKVFDNQEEFFKIDSSLVSALDAYILEHPINITYGKKLDEFYEEGFSHPSYHIYFNENQLDTILTIALFPELNTFDLDGIEGETEDETIFLKTYPKGFFNYRKRNPVVVFDKKAIANKFYNKQVLYSIPDSLITTNIDDIRDYKIDRWTYKIKNGKILNRIE